MIERIAELVKVADPAQEMPADLTQRLEIIRDFNFYLTDKQYESTLLNILAELEKGVSFETLKNELFTLSFNGIFFKKVHKLVRSEFGTDGKRVIDYIFSCELESFKNFVGAFNAVMIGLVALAIRIVKQILISDPHHQVDHKINSNEYLVGFPQLRGYFENILLQKMHTLILPLLPDGENLSNSPGITGELAAILISELNSGCQLLCQNFVVRGILVLPDTHLVLENAIMLRIENLGRGAHMTHTTTGTSWGCPFGSTMFRITKAES